MSGCTYKSTALRRSRGWLAAVSLTSEKSLPTISVVRFRPTVMDQRFTASLATCATLKQLSTNVPRRDCSPTVTKKLNAEAQVISGAPNRSWATANRSNRFPHCDGRYNESRNPLQLARRVCSSTVFQSVLHCSVMTVKPLNSAHSSWILTTVSKGYLYCRAPTRADTIVKSV